MTVDAQWVGETWENIETRYRIKAVLYEEKTDFQHMQLVESVQFGKMLLLDGIVQTTEKDEFYYHEMMAHVPVLSHPDPKQVLIIGGGDGGVLREVLKHPGVEKATMVEIDPTVVAFSRKYLPGISNGAFDDPRTDLVYADGAAYIRKTPERYDVAIVDSPDPIGPAQVLFGKAFYADIDCILNPGGVMVRQTGSLCLQPEEQIQAYKILKDIFTHTHFYVYSVPTYVGGLFSSVFCAKSVNPDGFSIDAIKDKYVNAGIVTRYYNPGIHMGAFHLPGFFKDRLP